MLAERRYRLRVASRVYVERPPAAVWALLSDVRRWAEWSPLCRDCRVAPAGPLAAGAVLNMRLRFRFLTLPARATLSCVQPNREIGWEATWLGIKARHRYSVRPDGRGSAVYNEELFEGLGPLARGLVHAWFRATNLSLESLAGIKRVAERDGAAGRTLAP